MNAGKDYKRARIQAQANADHTGTPRYLHLYNGVWWIDKEPCADALVVLPDPAKRPSWRKAYVVAPRAETNTSTATPGDRSPGAGPFVGKGDGVQPP